MAEPVARRAPATVSPGRLDRFCRRAVRRSLASFEQSRIELLDRTSGGGVERFGVGGAGQPAVAVEIHDPRFWQKVALGGTVGAGEAYFEGMWDASDLTALVRLFVRNRAGMERVEGGMARWLRPLLRRWHARRENTPAGARRNVAAHYDLGNDFFERLLDPTMTYSCALFERPGATLEEAQVAKLDRVCRKLGLRGGHRLVEIGTGWGSLAIHAARTTGCRVTTTTLSKEQARLARERIAAAGLADRIEVVERDFRDLAGGGLAGAFDRLVSIEMIEAVGLRLLPRYFAECARLLRPDGAAAIQAITIDEAIFESACRGVDFIQRWVFPGSALPSLSSMVSAWRATDLRLVHLEDLTAHYPPTLRAWAENLTAHRDELEARGYDRRMRRLFEFYLAYCEGGFLERSIGDVQMVLAKPGFREVPIPGARS
ncbi:MAG TPA: cyclopropane-fatty-acyl-phospholipid synthase family protein [Thermoanaerobaculia bacterium]|nr:cyclopropane-fatty-acyl-phospholipid synthase family protein [Thermoanaerobaculia bacterium]